jgi:hypothetical protein
MHETQAIADPRTRLMALRAAAAERVRAGAK